MNMKKQSFFNFPLGNKKIRIIILMIFIASLFSFSAFAAARDILNAGLNPIENFFSGGWQNYEKTVIFVVFFFLFFSAFLIGAKKAFGKDELTRSHMTFAFAAAFLSAMIITTTMKFDWVNLEYLGWFLIGILVLSAVYALLTKIGLEKHKFWAFILALILTALLLWLIWYLMQGGRPLEGLGKFSDWFGSLNGVGETGISGTGEGKGNTELWPGGVEPAKGEGAAGGATGGGGSKVWQIVFIVIVLAVLGGGGVMGWKKIKGIAGKGEGRLSIEELEEPIKKIVLYFNEMLRRKEIVSSRLDILEKNKKKTLSEIPKLTEEIQRAGGTKKFIDDIAPYLQNPKHKKNKRIRDEAEGIKKLILDDHTIMRALRVLAGVERYLINNSDLVKQHIQISKIEENKKSDLAKRIDNLKGVSSSLIPLLVGVFKLKENQNLINDKITKVLNYELMGNRLREKWIVDEIENEKELKNVIGKEDRAYSEIRKLIKEQKQIIKGIVDKILEKTIVKTQDNKVNNQKIVQKDKVPVRLVSQE